AYGSLLKARRARLHALFAAWPARGGEQRDDLSPLLGHPYAGAARPEGAPLAWVGGGGGVGSRRRRPGRLVRPAREQGIRRYDIDEGVRFLAQAVELTSDANLRAALWRQVGEANALRYDGESFAAAMQRSLELCTDRVTCGGTYALLAFHTASRSGMWSRQLDPGAVDVWIERALELSPPQS